MKRIFWTVGVGFAGFLFGGILGLNTGSIIGLVWGSSIGYGFGSIFSQTRPTKWIIAYWGATMALVGPIFSLQASAEIFVDPTLGQDISAAVIGAVGGALIGFLIGVIQLWRLRSKSQAHSNSVA